MGYERKIWKGSNNFIPIFSLEFCLISLQRVIYSKFWNFFKARDFFISIHLLVFFTFELIKMGQNCWFPNQILLQKLVKIGILYQND